MPDVKWIATSLVSLVVAIIVIATVAVPVIEEQGAGVTISGKNTGYTARYTDMSSHDFTYTIEADGTASYTLTSDGTGTKYTSPTASPGIIVGDDIIIRSGSTGYFLYYMPLDILLIATSLNNTASTIIYYTSSNHEWMIETELSLGGKSATKTNYYSGTADFVLLSTTDGPIGQFENKAINVTLGSTVYAGAYSVSESGPIRMAKFTDGTKTGDVFSPFTWTNYDQSAGFADLVAAEVSYSVSYEVTGETQQIGKYTGLTTTYGSTTSTSYAFYAPIDYTSTSAGEDSGGTNSVLLGIVPVMLFIVAVMMAVRVLQQAR